MPSFKFRMEPSLKERIEKAIASAREDVDQILADREHPSELTRVRITVEGRIVGIERALIEIARDIDDLRARPQD